MSTAVVGRQRELAILVEAYDDAGTGATRMAEIVGDPGIGKTTLLQAFTDRLRAQGQTVLAGRADEFEQVPFAAFVTALDGEVARLGPDGLAALGPETVALLAQVLPAVAGGTTAPADGEPAGGVERYRLHQAIRRLLELIARGRGLVLALDDVHWADDGSIEQIDHLLRYPPSGRFLLVVTYRQRQAPPRLIAALEEPVPGTQVQVALEPLTRAEAAELIGTRLPEPARAELYRASGGNPFYLDALVRAGNSYAAVSADGPAALSRELSALSPAARRTAQGAAVAGQVFDPELAAAAAELSHQEVLVALDELAARDLIRPGPAGRGFRFRHPLVRSAVYHTASAPWRQDAHGRAAEHLRAIGATTVARAHHVERAARPGDPAAIDVLVDAADSASWTGPELAARWLRTAIGLLPRADERRRGELLLRRARALALSGHGTESLALLTGLLDRWAPGQPGHRAEAAALAGAMHRFVGHHHEAVALLEAELAGHSDPDTAPAAALMLELTYAYIHVSRWADAYRLANRVIETTVRYPGRTLDAAGGTGLRALAAAQARDPAAWRYLAHAAAQLDSVPDGELAERLFLASEIGWVEVMHGLFRDARRHYARGVALARRTGQHHILVALLYGVASADTWLGRLAEAAEALDAAVAVARSLGERNLYPAVLARRGEVALWQGDLDAAAGWVARSIEAQRSGRYLWSGHAELIQARITLARGGDPAGDVDELIRLGGGPDLPAMTTGAHSLWCDVLAQAELARGRVEEAAAWAQRSAARPVLDGVLDFAPLTRARVLLAAGGGPAESVEAVEAATRTADQAARAGARLVEASARQVLGAVHAAAGDLPAAREAQRRAKALYADCGAHGLQADVAAAQRRVGSRSSRTRGGGLTDREAEIAEMVARGHSNIQIAEKLALSRRTVETHLSHIFIKLDVSTRAGLARHMHDR